MRKLLFALAFAAISLNVFAPTVAYAEVPANNQNWVAGGGG